MSLIARNLRITVALLTVATVGLVVGVLLVPKIQAAREEARNRPHVSLWGHGSSNHFTYHLAVSGVPTIEVEQKSAAALRGLETSIRSYAEAGEQHGVRIYTSLYIHAPPELRDQLAALAETIPGLDGVVINRAGE